jgi:signal peptidase I
MQPTLYGVTSENLLRKPDFKIPTGMERVKQWFEGISYIHIVADNDGEINRVDAPRRLLIFNIKQTLWLGGKPYTIWFPPDYGQASLESRAELPPRHYYHVGDDVVKLRVQAGDHLFVDRLSYNFRPPERGEIIVFETKGIPEERRAPFNIPADQFYIKRLVALGGERVQLNEDRHLRIDGKRLDTSTPHFENVYSFDPKEPPRDSHYCGHVNFQYLTPFFQGKPDGVVIPPGQYMVMGDNTMNSLDSRSWGPFPAQSVIGKSFFVYWPITERFGWGYYR